MWTYKHLSHRKSGHTITTRSCNAKEIPILDLSIHRHGSFSLSLSCQFINAVFLCFREVSGVFRRSPPYIQQWTIWPDMGNQTVELNWILELSELSSKATSSFPHPEKNQIPSWLWGKSQSFLSSEGNRYCTGMLLFPWQDCMICSTTYYYFHRIF